jgi:demethylmenaquinone methyltransferase/2-methoxy-6-polyprenyl-1,4-benzoquinol methylase
MPANRIPIEQADSRLMRGMFHTIAPRYDFITRAFSYGMDKRWKRALMDRAELPEAPLILDLASGTGDFSQLAVRRYPRSRPVAADLTERMLQLARARGVQRAACADALCLPFPDAAFDCVCVGYGLRNFPDLKAAVSEIARVTRPGGKLLTLDFFLPSGMALRRAYLGYLYAQGAFWGLLLHGRPRVYTYIPDSLKSFVAIQEFSGMLRHAGYHRVEHRGFLLGGIGLHWAVKKHA